MTLILFGKSVSAEVPLNWCYWLFPSNTNYCLSCATALNSLYNASSVYCLNAVMYLDWKYSQNSVPDVPFLYLQNVGILHWATTQTLVLHFLRIGVWQKAAGKFQSCLIRNFAFSADSSRIIWKGSINKLKLIIGLCKTVRIEVKNGLILMSLKYLIFFVHLDPSFVFVSIQNFH